MASPWEQYEQDSMFFVDLSLSFREEVCSES